MAETILVCPVCGEKLAVSGKTYTCPNHHSFDIARSGYVNLLLSKHTGKSIHGDNKLMLQARRDFLEQGHYSPLCTALCRTVTALAGDSCTLLDAGCGEGWYTAAVSESLREAGTEAYIYGIDISKTAVELAAKRRCGVTFAAASVFRLPVLTESCDVLVTMFAPYAGEEFRRVLIPGGAMVMAIPSENHLWELKKAVYSTPYRNEVKDYALEGFSFLGSERVSFTMELTSPEEIRSLFSMTPYYYRTGRTEQERLESLSSLTTQADFEILTYRKK